MYEQIFILGHVIWLCWKQATLTARVSVHENSNTKVIAHPIEKEQRLSKKLITVKSIMFETDIPDANSFRV